MDKINKSMNAYAIPGVVKPPRTPEQIIEDIIQAVIETIGITRQQLIKKGNKEDHVAARQLVCLFVKKYIPTMRQEDIGKIIHRDRTTVVHSIVAIKNLLDTKNDKTVFWYNEIYKKIR